MRLFALVFSLLVCLTACKKQQEQPYIRIDKSTVDVIPEGENIDIRVDANVDYTLGPLADWITLINRIPNKGYALLSFQVKENSDAATRQHTINLVSENFTTAININQNHFREIGVSAGNLKGSIKQAFNSVKKLILSGTLNKLDFEFMRDELPVLEYLDLSKINMKGYDRDYPENELPALAFYTSRGSDGVGKKSLKTVILPQSITSIGDHAFTDCQSLTEITIPSAVVDIEAGAFSQCTKMEKLTFEHNSNLEIIRSFAFYACALKSIEFPNSLKTIEYQSFQGCRYLTGDLRIPPPVTIIDFLAFSSCNQLTSLTFAEGSKIHTIGDGAFLNCTNLSGTIFIPESVNQLGSGMLDYGAFEGCSKIQTLVFEPRNYSLAIHPAAFKDCTSLSSTIHIPSQTYKVGKEAFSHCMAVDHFEFYWTYPIPEFTENAWPAGKTCFIPRNYTNDYIAKGWPQANLKERNE